MKRVVLVGISMVLAGACAARDLRPEPEVYEQRGVEDARITLDADGTFVHETPAWGASRGLWWMEDRRLVLQASPEPVIEGFGRISPIKEQVPIQILDRQGRPQGAWARFYGEEGLLEQGFIEDGRLEVSRYLPFFQLEICATRFGVGGQRGPVLEDAAFHEPYAAYRITVDLGRPFEGERWRVRGGRLVQPARYSWRRQVFEREEERREILPGAAVAP